MLTFLISVVVFGVIMAISYAALFAIWRPKSLQAKLTLVGFAAVLPTGLWSLVDFVTGVINGTPQAQDFVFAAVCLTLSYFDYQSMKRSVDEPEEA